ncbi:MAG: VWA domain-containing protein [Syntrophaceae bacterium]|nr:VWA domain-containing protein [Syntrophaceae bacterium]
MKETGKEGKVILKASVDKPVIARDKPGMRILEIVVTPPETKDKKEHAPLNLSLVLDRSGSMSGDKLHFVKQAAAHVVDLLSETDQASVTVYDNYVETLFPAIPMTDQNKVQAKTSIQEVRTGGSTNLSGGWLKGCEEIAKAATDSTINRTLLLTDGLANQGIRDIDELSTHARELFARGVSTSCFGVGEGYNEHILEAMANSGGGNFHFLETLSAIPVVFEREFKELITVSLRDVEITLKLPPQTKAEVAAGWQSKKIEDQLKIFLGNLHSGQKQSIYIKINFDEGLDCDEIIVPVIVRGKGDTQFLYEETETVTLKTVSFDEEAATELDAELMARFALVDVAEKANEALKRERAGDRNGASHLMQESLQDNRSYLPAPMIEKYQYMETQMRAGMSEDVRKRHHRQEYENRRGRELVRHYNVKLVNGRLVAEIEGRSVLVASGFPTSAGEGRNWYFLNELHPLRPDHEGVSLDLLSKKLGIQVDMLLGTDIMYKYNVTIDLFRQRMQFTQNPLPQYSGVRVAMDSTWGVKISPCSVAGQPCRMIVDSSAKLSYVDREIAAQLSPIGKETDFYASVGEFETPVYEVPVQVSGLDFTARCGVLPRLLEKTLFVRGKRSIIGSELFQKYVVDLAFPEKYVLLQPGK